VRWVPSTSADVQGYVLSIGTSSRNYNTANDVQIPLQAASAGANGTLTYTIQIDRSRDQFLAMRAYDAASFSQFSNEIRLGAVVASTAAPSSGSTSTDSTDAVVASASALRSLGSSGGTSASAAPDADAGSADAAAEEQTADSAEAFVSLDLNGADEYLATTVATPLDLSAGFSASLWGKTPIDGSGRRGLLQVACAEGASPCALELALVNGANGPAIELRVFDAASAADDVQETPAPIANDEWWHLALVLDPAAATARIYLDGELLSERTGLQLPESMFTAEHLLSLGAADSTRAAPWLGRLGHVAVFSAVLGAAEIAEISMRGHDLDLRGDAGAYQASGSLAHYWRLGGDPAAVGSDSGVAPVDFDDPYGNLDADDVVRDAPESLVSVESVASAGQ
jgi:hypothetical protein